MYIYIYILFLSRVHTYTHLFEKFFGRVWVRSITVKSLKHFTRVAVYGTESNCCCLYGDKGCTPKSCTGSFVRHCASSSRVSSSSIRGNVLHDRVNRPLMCDSFHCATERGYRALNPSDRDFNYRSLLIMPRSHHTGSRSRLNWGGHLAEMENPEIGDIAICAPTRPTGDRQSVDPNTVRSYRDSTLARTAWFNCTSPMTQRRARARTLALVQRQPASAFSTRAYAMIIRRRWASWLGRRGVDVENGNDDAPARVQK